MMRRVLKLTIALILVAWAAGAEEVPLTQLLQRTSAHLEWDAYRGQGVLSDGVNTLAFRIGWPSFVLNSREQHALGKVTSENGTLLVTEEAATYIESLFKGQASASAQHGTQRRYVSTIFLDPGHGGKDPGAIGWHMIDGKMTAVREKDVVLRVGKLVEAMLKEHYPSRRIELSRDEDTYLSLEKRTQLANEIPRDRNDSTVFVSIHANASLKKSAHGFEVWYLPPEYRRTLLDSSTVAPSSVSVLPILNSMLEEEYTIESILLGRSILDGLDTEVGSESPRLGMKDNPWAVVRNAKMPSVLVEIGFLTNAIEGVRLNDPVYLRKIATGIYNGIVRYVTSYEQRNTVE